MKEAKNLIIGFGKAGKTLASFLAKKGEKTILVEKSNKMYGGTCINVACIPSKSLEYSARESSRLGGNYEERAIRYQKAIEDKEALTYLLRKKNYDMVVNAGAEVIDGLASFIDEHTIEVKETSGNVETIKADRIFINTGSTPVIPPLDGLKDNPNVFTSETLMSNPILPKKLTIIGGGYIGLEFASYYANFGSEVTIIQDGDTFIPREDQEVAKSVEESFEIRGIKILKSAKIIKVNKSNVEVDYQGKTTKVEGDAILVATGRRPNIISLNLEKAHIELTDRGAIKTDIHKKTNIDHIFAMGDVTGGMQFTYISLDDFRIVKDYLYGEKIRSTDNRGAIPYTVFLDPPLSRVGLSEEEAKAKGYQIKVGKLLTAAVPKARVLQSTVGMMKVIIDSKTDLILGAHLFCIESYEMINLLKLAIDQKIPYTVLRDNIYNHPTMSEAFNDLFGNVK